MKLTPHRRTVAILACAASLGGTVLAVAPSGALAAGTCPNKTVAIKEKGGPAVHIPVKAISARGLSCGQAYAVITLTISGKLPKAWKSVANTHFTVPAGLVPQELKASGGRIIEYGVHGG